MWMLTFLPGSLDQAFSTLIPVALPALVSGLSNSTKNVREVALRVGKVIIRSNRQAQVDIILNWLIRVFSLTLLGDLLDMIGGGTKESNTTEEDDAPAVEQVQAQNDFVVGAENRRRVLSSLYMVRSNSAAKVQHNAVKVWKSIVSVTPRTMAQLSNFI
mmetsp:Transcript_5962/g.8980  ORF Transcript_5962/g.8980 Transcript_5962/m.8980 type:complete len:159 (+) Transcript_5962:275-751(+)